MKNTNIDKQCLIVQSDYTILLERKHEAFADARDFLLHFAELEKCPEHFHTYRVTRLSLWNAAALGLNSGQVIR